MSHIIHDKEGNAFELTTSEEAQGRTDVAMEFKTQEEALAFVHRLGETAQGREQLRRMVEEVKQAETSAKGQPDS